MSASFSLRLGLQAHLVFLVNVALLRVRIWFSSLVIPATLTAPEMGGHRYRKLMNILQQASLRQALVWGNGNREFPQATHPAGLRG